MKGASNLGKKILIVDDAVFMRIKLKDILEKKWL
jgi:two-component system chemotaxis response regulator CheY